MKNKFKTKKINITNEKEYTEYEAKIKNRSRWDLKTFIGQIIWFVYLIYIFVLQLHFLF